MLPGPYTSHGGLACVVGWTLANPPSRGVWVRGGVRVRVRGGVRVRVRVRIR